MEFLRSGSFIRSIVLSSLWLIAVVSTAYATPDSTRIAPDSTVWSKHSRESTLFLGRFNADSLQDTLIGKVTGDYRSLPDRIAWGRSGHGNPSSKFRYPRWQKLSGAIAVQDLNRDSLPDLVFYLRGKVDTSSRRSVSGRDTTRAELKDTARVIAVFGQNTSIDLANFASSFQSSPFFAMDLVAEEILIEPAIRDVSGKMSYLLKPVSLPRTPSSLQRDSLSSSDGVHGIPSWISIYPNPTGTTANVEVRRLAEGEYRVQLIAVNGSLYFDQIIRTDQSGNFIQHLRLEKVPTGYYFVQVYQREKVLHSYPVVVVH